MYVNIYKYVTLNLQFKLIINQILKTQFKHDEMYFITIRNQFTTDKRNHSTTFVIKLGSVK